MPIQMRLARGRYGRLYSRITHIINMSEQYIIFGTYSINTDLTIVRQIIDKKRSNPNIFICAFIPPPTDFIIWDWSIRNAFATAYGMTSNVGEALNEAIANNPIPAFNILEARWRAARLEGRRRRYNQIFNSIRQIYNLQNSNLNVLLEPNTHAKFILTESDIYEGSGNLTYYGLEVNVEVYNFYSIQYPRVYNYCARSYYDFLLDYFQRFVIWKDGSNYIRNASSLGQTVTDLISDLQIRFNPHIDRNKMNKIREVRIKLSTIRSILWMLPGLKTILINDLLSSLADRKLSTILSSLYQHSDDETIEDKENDISLEDINNQIESTNRLLKHLLINIRETRLEIDDEEQKYNDISIKAFKEFIPILEQRITK